MTTSFLGLAAATQLWSLLIIVVELLGIVAAVHALMNVRSDRGTTAWCVALVAMPFIALPLYAVFGRSKFTRYREIISEVFDVSRSRSHPLAESVTPYHVEFEEPPESPEALLAKLSPFSFTRGNQLELLIDGEATFAAIFQALREARRYILIEFFIIRDDELGRELRDLLVDKAADGIEVYFLYDRIGSKKLSTAYLQSLRQAGVQTASFGPPRRRLDFFHLNFRNHRKIVVVDGATAFVGGHNVGDEYLGKNPKFGHWRDTHARVSGPAAQDCQRVFLESWYWATRELPTLEHLEAPPEYRSDCRALVLATGPIRGGDVCTLAYKALINSAKRRCWIASPYFVPTTSIMDVLRYAALRGVDVRILLPAKPDHMTVYLASHTYLEALEAWDIKVYRYEEGFLHQKVILVDDALAGVTTINLDPRSFHLNFEVGLFSPAREFVDGVAAMLESDFASSRQVSAGTYHSRPLYFRVAANVARLFSPVL